MMKEENPFLQGILEDFELERGYLNWLGLTLHRMLEPFWRRLETDKEYREWVEKVINE